MPKPLDYAIPIDGAIYFIAKELDRAATALSLSDVQRAYSHSNPADYSRVIKYEKLADEQEAKAWIINFALEHMTDSVTIDGDTIRFADGKGYDDVKDYQGQPIKPPPDLPKELRDLFSKVDGPFSVNIRAALKSQNDPAYDELTESLKTFGWIPELPAIRDEFGVVLVGHRRISIAAKLGIEPVFMDVKVGRGTAADVRRLALAIASNIGRRDLTPNDRKHIAKHLRIDAKWELKAIATALKVTTRTIMKDLQSEVGETTSPASKPLKDNENSAERSDDAEKDAPRAPVSDDDIFGEDPKPEKPKIGRPKGSKTKSAKSKPADKPKPAKAPKPPKSPKPTTVDVYEDSAFALFDRDLRDVDVAKQIGTTAQTTKGLRQRWVGYQKAIDELAAKDRKIADLKARLTKCPHCGHDLLTE